jgi:16S rRNA (uracil1498-N3)-methyltransferase
MQLYYVDHCDGTEAIAGQAEAHHIKNVLRQKVGDMLQVTDGKGNCWKARISSVENKQIIFTIEELIEKQERSNRFWLAVAPTKQSARIEWMVEKATELGVDGIQFIYSRHTERKNINTDRIQRIVLSAMKQSRHLFLPQIPEMQSFEQFLQTFEMDACDKFIAHYLKSNSFLADLQTLNHTVILIGPEGDFSAREMKMAHEYGYRAINLSSFRLRTETAAIAAISTLNILAHQLNSK